MAESNRRGEGAAAEHVEDVFDDAVDDDAELTEESPTDKKSTKAASNKDAKDAKAAKRSEGRGLFGLRRIWLFFREVIGELRKVIWPTRNDLLTYTAVVVVFVAIMMTLVGLLDLGYAKGVLYIFGNPK
ncbi:preprotein translocase subunit SecE [Hamadaea sp. NPDC051192]|uniref:preprotein translocase subunit SecE n=1 Tax=Hamadaea sp. NPDC051192 TaxID=3154940 RepID=UPI00343D23FA